MIYLLSTIIIYLAYIFYVGGDHMQAYRLIVPIIPLSILLLYLILKVHLHNFTNRQVAVIYLVILFLVSLQIFDPRINPQNMDPAAYYGSIVGRYIASSWPKGSLIALHTAGSTPYFAPNHRFIDMLGLNNRHIAKREVGIFELPWQLEPGHTKGDGAYVLSRNPDYIIVGPSHGAIITDPWFLSDLEMSQDPEFSNNYQMQQVELPGLGIFTYYKRVEKE
jgi:hypothetical protein